MPSRKLTDRRGSCGCKNHLRARYCNSCGHKLDENRAIRDAEGRAKLHADIAHPINSACREVIQTAVLRSYHEEKERSKQPGYVCRYDDYDDDYEGSFSAIVNDLTHGSRPGPDGYRAHGPHSHPRGVHQPPAHQTATQPVAAHQAPRETEQQSERSFGEGIL